MQDFIYVTGIILRQAPAGEYDRRVTLLTKERGKITAFARGARKQGNRLAAATNSFVFGRYKLIPGRNAYTMTEAEVQNYFEELMTDVEGACYGMYFAEIADYYTRENNDELMMLKLLYQTLKALGSPKLPRPLVRCIYECKAIAVNGEYPGAPSGRGLSEAAIYALNYIGESSIEKLYTFLVTDEVLAQMQEIAGEFCRKYMKHEFKSLEILKTLG